MFKKIKTVLFILIGLYLLFAIGFGIIPYAIPKEISAEMKPQFDLNRFYGADEQSVDRVTLAESPQSGFDSRIRLIREAQTSIDLVCHSVKDGVTSEQIFAELLDAADRGVQVLSLIHSLQVSLKTPAPPPLTSLLSTILFPL